MFEGLPSVFEYVIGLATRRQKHDSFAVVVYHLLGDIVNAAELALVHYFPLTLEDSCLQNSSIGPPYAKWAKFTNEDFQEVDQCLQRLIPVGWRGYEQLIHESPEGVYRKEAWHWFHSVKLKYSCCVIDELKPTLTLAAININGWVKSTQALCPPK